VSQLAVAKCEELQRIVQAKNDEVKLLGDQPAVPKIDNKMYCVDCHMKRAGGPPPGMNTSDAEYMSLSQSASVSTRAGVVVCATSSTARASTVSRLLGSPLWGVSVIATSRTV
jgi:hypothetical protein